MIGFLFVAAAFLLVVFVAFIGLMMLTQCIVMMLRNDGTIEINPSSQAALKGGLFTSAP